MSADNNQFGIDYAFPGLCSLCHTEIGIFEGSDVFGRPKVKKFMANSRHVDIILDTGSKMKVMLCKDCHKTFNPKDCGALMESEINGWYKEVEQCCPKWTQEKKDNYIKKMSQRYIKDRANMPFFTVKSDGIPKPKESNFIFEFDDKNSLKAKIKEDK